VGTGGGAAATGGTGGTGPGVTPEEPIPPGTSDPTDPECNLAGAWLLRSTVTSVANGDDQVARRWYLYEIAQEGARFQISTALNCQVRVKTDPYEGIGRADVTMNDAALAAVLARNSHAGTQGTFVKEGDECAFEMDPVYEVRGVNGDKYLPDDPTAYPDLADLLPLPTAGDDPDVSDWDGDGEPGLRWDIDTPLLDGWRDSGQRDVQRFYSVAGDATYAVPLEATEFTVKLDIDMEEVVYAAKNDLFASVGVLKDVDHYGEMQRLADDRESIPDLPSDDLEACRYLEETLLPF
jgi:hypothetical protein